MSKTFIRANTIIGLAASVTIASWAIAGNAKTYDLKIGFASINGPQHRSSEYFKKEIEKRTNGRFKVRLFPAAQLGKIPRQIEGVQLGTQEAFHTPPGFFVGINQAYMALDAPGVFEGIDHLHRVINHPKVRNKLLRLIENKGIIGSYLFGSGEGAFAARGPMNTFETMKNKKIRVLASKLEIEMMNVLGMTGIPMAYSEVLPAIQRKVLDGARSAIIVMGPSKFYSVAKHLTLTHGGFISTGLFFSKQWLNKLPPDLRKALFDIGPEAGNHALKLSHGLNRFWEKRWVEEGGTIHRLSAETRKEFMRRTEPVGDKVLLNNPKTRDMWMLIKSVAKETRGG